MVEKRKKHKRGTICEKSVSTLLERYSATTVLSLLQEVAQVADVKIDWNALVKKTSTGISNAREYQMLWRHLAYRDSLLEKLEDGAEPLSDDSDLDYELEPHPPVSSEASTEAAACVKVMIASGLQSVSSLPNGATVEAPLTINIPNSQLAKATLENSQQQGTNITFPVSVQKQHMPTVLSAEGLETNATSGNLPPRKKRKPWSEAEDMELIAAVQKCGEGNWANILKGDFKSARTASQLSQRWAIIRKRQGNVNVGGGSQLSEAQLAARRAMSLALNMPMDNLKAAACSSNAGISSSATTTNSTCLAVVEASTVDALPQQQSQQDNGLATTSKSWVASKKLPTKPGPDELVKAAAVAAGARIASPSDAASLLKAAQGKNAVHIIPGSGLPPNVHFIRTGLVTTPSSAYSSASANASRPQAQSNSPKSASRAVPLNPTSAAAELTLSSEAANNAKSGQDSEVKVKTVEDPTCPLNGPKEQGDEATVSGDTPKEQGLDDEVANLGNVQSDQGKEAAATLGVSLNEVGEQAFIDGDASQEKVKKEQASVSADALREKSHGDQDSLAENFRVQEDESSLVLGEHRLVEASAEDKNNKPKEQVQEDQTARPSSEARIHCKNNLVDNSKCSQSPETARTGQMTVVGYEATSLSKNGDDKETINVPVRERSNKQRVVDQRYENMESNAEEGAKEGA